MPLTVNAERRNERRYLPTFDLVEDGIERIVRDVCLQMDDVNVLFEYGFMLHLAQGEIGETSLANWFVHFDRIRLGNHFELAAKAKASSNVKAPFSSTSCSSPKRAAALAAKATLAISESQQQGAPGKDAQTQASSNLS